MLFLFLYSILYILFYVIVCVILLKFLLFNPLFSIIYVNISYYAYNAILYITTPVFVMFRSPSMIIWRPSGSYLAIRIPATKFSTTVLNRRSRSAATVCLQYFAVSNIYRFGHLKRKNSNCLSSKDLPFLHKYCQCCLFSVLSTPSTSYRVGAPFPTASCPLWQKRLRLTSRRTFWACNSRPLPRTPGQQIRRKGYWS